MIARLGSGPTSFPLGACPSGAGSPGRFLWGSAFCWHGPGTHPGAALALWLRRRRSPAASGFRGHPLAATPGCLWCRPGLPGWCHLAMGVVRRSQVSSLLGRACAGHDWSCRRVSRLERRQVQGAKKKPRRRQGFEVERFQESVLVSTLKWRSPLLTHKPYGMLRVVDRGRQPAIQLAPAHCRPVHSLKGITCRAMVRPGSASSGASSPPPPPLLPLLLLLLWRQ